MENENCDISKLDNIIKSLEMVETQSNKPSLKEISDSLKVILVEYSSTDDNIQDTHYKKMAKDEIKDKLTEYLKQITDQLEETEDAYDEDIIGLNCFRRACRKIKIKLELLSSLFSTIHNF